MRASTSSLSADSGRRALLTRGDMIFRMRMHLASTILLTESCFCFCGPSWMASRHLRSTHWPVICLDGELSALDTRRSLTWKMDEAGPFLVGEHGSGESILNGILLYGSHRHPLELVPTSYIPFCLEFILGASLFEGKKSGERFCTCMMGYEIEDTLGTAMGQ